MNKLSILKEEIQQKIKQYNQLLKSNNQGKLQLIESECEQANAFEILKNTQKKIQRDENRQKQLKQQQQKNRLQMINLTENKAANQVDDTQMEIEPNADQTEPITNETNLDQNNQNYDLINQKDPEKVHRRNYSVDLKTKVVTHSNIYGIKNASIFYEIPYETVSNWISKENKKESLIDQRKHNRRPIKYPQIESELIQFILDQRNKGLPLSLQRIFTASQSIAKEQNISQFQCSKNWMSGFLNRHSLSLRKKNNTFQLNQSEIQKRVLEYIQDLQQNKYYLQYDILVNMDESAYFYNNNQIYTYEIKGSKKVSIKSGGNEKEKVTICASIGIKTDKMEGIIIKPFIIFKNKSKKPSTLELLQKQYKEKAKITHTRSGWQNNDSILQYCEHLHEQLKQILPYNQRKCLLIWDQYKVHQNNQVNLKLQQLGIDILFIPGGTTGLLQPLDVGIFKGLKVKMNKLFVEWQEKNEDNNIVINKPEKSQFIEWVIQTMNEVDINYIKKLFEITGLTLQMDKLSIELLSSDIIQQCNELIENLNVYLQDQQEEFYNYPYLDDYQLQIQDLFFNDVIAEQIQDYLKN